MKRAPQLVFALCSALALNSSITHGDASDSQARQLRDFRYRTTLAALPPNQQELVSLFKDSSAQMISAFVTRSENCADCKKLQETIDGLSVKFEDIRFIEIDEQKFAWFAKLHQVSAASLLLMNRASPSAKWKVQDVIRGLASEAEISSALNRLRSKTTSKRIHSGSRSH